MRVHRRTGGLEKKSQRATRPFAVHRRTGGLENTTPVLLCATHVHRRTGGLEIMISSATKNR